LQAAQRAVSLDNTGAAVVVGAAVKKGAYVANLIRMPQVVAILPVSKTGLYQLISTGIFPPPVKIGAASAWDEAEVKSVVAAMLAKVPADGVRELVTELVACRKFADTDRRRAAIVRKHLQGG
jgi:predicted DNA-binding transcriptional regulator AlpA